MPSRSDLGSTGRNTIIGYLVYIPLPQLPLYALVAGSPAKIVGVKFNIEQILEHDNALCPKSERISREELEALFAEYYEGKKVFGVQTELTEEDIKNLDWAKKKRQYYEPNITD